MDADKNNEEVYEEVYYDDEKKYSGLLDED